MVSPKTTTSPGRWALLTGLAGLVSPILFTACTFGGPATPGPLGEAAEGGDSGEICVPAARQGQYALGMEVLSNPGNTDAVITGVDLVDARGLKLVDAVVIDIDGLAIGARTSWPPTGAADTPAWRTAVPADGATIPANSTNRKNLVLHLSAEPNQPASLKAYKITYKVGRTTHEMQTTYALLVKASCV